VQTMGGNDKPISLSVRGENLNKLSEIAEKVETIVKSTNGTVDVENSLEISKPEVRVQIDREKASDLAKRYNISKVLFYKYLDRYKKYGVKHLQAEDEIAGICSAIGASFAGSFACTTTSGPGLSLKSEAIGLAVITELPLVIVNVQRGGPSTGLPTKSEQSDLYQALFGRNGECPAIVIAASSPADCFFSAYEAGRLSMEHMTPVILLTDGYIGFGSEVLKIPQMK